MLMKKDELGCSAAGLGQALSLLAALCKSHSLGTIFSPQELCMGPSHLTWSSVR